MVTGAFTVTVKLQLPSGEAVDVTAVVPTGKKEPEAGEELTVPQELLPDVASKVTTAPWIVGSLGSVVSATTTISSGHVKLHAGGVPVDCVCPFADAEVAALMFVVSVVRVTVLSIEVPAPTVPTRYCTVNVTPVFAGRSGTVQTTFPELPTPGSVHVMPVGLVGTVKP
jgi:hypothetical protein